MRRLGVFLKEKRREIILYTAILFIFSIVCYLYDVRIDAVEYALLLSFICFLFYLFAELLHFCRQQDKLDEICRSIPENTVVLPDAKGILEEKYQQILTLFYEQKAELESEKRISRQEMTDYYGMWVHQIKTPIAAMHVILQSLDGADTGALYVRELKMELFKIEQYVEMVLTYLRMEEMSSDLQFEKCSLDEIIKSCIRKYSQMFILQKVKVDLRPTGKTVLTDEKWISFVLEQLLSNALKYTKSNGMVQNAEIAVYMSECKGQQVLVVEDNGIGIRPEDLPRVFERGFTGFNGRSDKKSTGIGLYLCRRIMDRLGHQIWMESEVGAGTKVYLALEREKLNVE